jgi:BlaI family transcriptional regulator, penicillinase repressor
MTAHLTRRELDVMAVVWRRGSATVGEVLDELSDDLAYSTVLTIFRTLEAKGHVRHEQEGKAHRFYARTMPEEAGDTVLTRLLHKVYRGSREALLAQLVSDRDLSAAELKRLRKLLDQRIKEAAR